MLSDINTANMVMHQHNHNSDIFFVKLDIIRENKFFIQAVIFISLVSFEKIS